ncbi:MAG TPA: hypothetical protein VGO52_05915 [Hyphomonadaceae bacterium]|jgi:hypothetical protein|nr:hypothetical protein [Hyphomonadaceae bacterium]
MTRQEILKKLDDATLLHHFEDIARSVDALPEQDTELLAAFRARLVAVGIENYPQQLCDYALRIMNTGEPISEEIFKVFWLAESVARSATLGLDDSERCMKELAEAIRVRSRKDGRYNATMHHIFGGRPRWLE